MSLNFRLIDENFIFDETIDTTPSSENVQFPASNLRKFFRSKVFRTNQNGNFVIDSTNNKIDFIDVSAGPELTATLVSGTYTAPTLATVIKTALELVGANTYTITFSTTTGKWSISTSGAFISLLFSTGTNAGTSVRDAIGYGDNDFTGATSYTGAFISIHTEESLVFDLKTTENLDSFAMIFDPDFGSRFTEDAVLKLQANATSNFSSPAVDITLSIDNENEIITHFFSADQAFRFWRLKMVDPANPDLFLEVPKVFLGRKIQITDGPALGFNFTTQDPSLTKSTDFGQKYTDILPQVKTLEIDFELLDIADIELLIDSYQRTGVVRPILVELDSDETIFDKDRFIIYGNYQDDLDTTQDFTRFLSTDLTIEEAF